VNLGHPLDGVTSPLTARVLEVLAGTTRPLSGREIHRLAGAGAQRGVLNVLDRLERSGFVTADHRSAATYYVANRDHLGWPSLEQLAGLRSALFVRLRDVIQGWGVAPLHASVFGSTARGDADDKSDLDLLLIRPLELDHEREAIWDEELESLRGAVRAWTGNRCQVFDIERERLAEHVRARDPIVRAWIADGISLAGAPLQELIGVPTT